MGQGSGSQAWCHVTQVAQSPGTPATAMKVETAQGAQKSAHSAMTSAGSAFATRGKLT